MAVVQRHYFQQLGVTFELRNPLVSTVAIDETAEKLNDASATLIFERAQRLVKTEFKRDYEYRENVIVTVFEGVQVGAGMGGANLAAVAEPFWRPAYETFRRAPSELPKAQDLHAWPHEMGHGFGLSHTVDTQECLGRFGINLGPLPSLIMQKRETRPSVYEYPFVAEEKKLLLDEAYYPNCRPLLGPRSHASTHLRHRLPVQAGTN